VTVGQVVAAATAASETAGAGEDELEVEGAAEPLP
jgi:hypothetical protein